MNTDPLQSLQFSWCRLEDFSAVQWHEIIAARLAVFVVEQHCPYQEADDLDAHAWHVQARINGQLAAYLRVVDPGFKPGHAGANYQEPSIGRVLTTRAFRGQGLGAALMQEGLAGCTRYFPGYGIRISAQAYLLKFYQGLGFQTASDVYDEDGIAHYEMWRPAGTAL
jgi:ElaA protein